MRQIKIRQWHKERAKVDRDLDPLTFRMGLEEPECGKAVRWNIHQDDAMKLGPNVSDGSPQSVDYAELERHNDENNDEKLHRTSLERIARVERTTGLFADADNKSALPPELYPHAVTASSLNRRSVKGLERILNLR